MISASDGVAANEIVPELSTLSVRHNIKNL
jgi:hypothetical protein